MWKCKKNEFWKGKVCMNCTANKCRFESETVLSISWLLGSPWIYGILLRHQLVMVIIRLLLQLFCLNRFIGEKKISKKIQHIVYTFCCSKIFIFIYKLCCWYNTTHNYLWIHSMLPCLSFFKSSYKSSHISSLYCLLLPLVL